ncbi:MAG: formylglycine-generating enzyme family protein [Treponema sp.]|jgi:formylglycine-generating enzyme required for sulfatase activity|nr:formylglycine-generating enzyme family protein [Treponema sp.]
MKKKIKFLGVAVLVTAIVIGFAACDGGGNGGHTHDWQAIDGGVAPTCTTPGSGKLKCTTCGEEKDGDTLAALGHDYGNWTTTTRTLTVLETRVCSHDPSHKETRGEIANSAQGVWINAGTFTMGSPESEPGRATNETQHSVTLTKGFYMGKYQVTQAQYEAVMGSNPSYYKTPVVPETNTDNRPVERVSWYDALVFCNKLSMLEELSPAYEMQTEANTAVWSADPATWGTVPTGSDTRWNAVRIAGDSDGYRLPTEAQWEYACRAGTETAFNDGETQDYSNTTAVNQLGWYSGNGNRTHGVGEKAANKWGLYDMHGNVFEWCWDWYNESYYSSSPTEDPAGAASGSDRVVRGGYYNFAASLARSAFRFFINPYNRDIAVGFRLVRPAQ